MAADDFMAPTPIDTLTILLDGVSMVGLAGLEKAAELLSSVAEYHRDIGDPSDDLRGYPILGSKVGTVKTRAQYAAARALIEDTLPAIDDPFGIARALGFHEPNDWIAGPALESMGASQVAASFVTLWLGMASFPDQRAFEMEGLPANSRVLATYPELRGLFTPRDHLLPVTDGVKLGHEWVEYRDHQIHLHPGFRRRFSGGINSALTHHLAKLREGGLRLHVGIDHYRLTPRGTLFPLMELDRWFGAPLDFDALNTLTDVQRIVHARVKHLGRFPEERAGLRSEFCWAPDGDYLKSFVAEELPDPDQLPARQREVACRFVHSQWDPVRRGFVHLDGAVAIYRRDRYLLRHQSSTDHHGSPPKADRKIKVFRIDSCGERVLSVDEWTRAVNGFFRGNELVLEYLSGRRYEDIYRQEYGREFPTFD